MANARRLFQTGRWLLVSMSGSCRQSTNSPAELLKSPGSRPTQKQSTLSPQNESSAGCFACPVTRLTSSKQLHDSAPSIAADLVFLRCGESFAPIHLRDLTSSERGPEDDARAKPTGKESRVDERGCRSLF